VGTGKTILEFRKNQHVYEQGDAADTVFYIQKAHYNDDKATDYRW